MQWSWLQCSAVAYSAFQLPTIQCSSLQCSAVTCSTVWLTTVQCSWQQWSAVDNSLVQLPRVQCYWLQFSSVSYSAVRLPTVQCSFHSAVPVFSSRLCLWCMEGNSPRLETVKDGSGLLALGWCSWQIETSKLKTIIYGLGYMRKGRVVSYFQLFDSRTN